MIRRMQVSRNDSERLTFIAASFFFDVAMFRTQVSEMMACTSSLKPLDFISLIRHGKGLESSASAKVTQLVPIDSKPTVDSDVTGQITYRFQSLPMMSDWIRFWTAQLCLGNILWNLVSRLQIPVHVQFSLGPKLSTGDVVSEAAIAAENITRSISFALGEAASRLPHKTSDMQRSDTAQAFGPLAISYALETICNLSIASAKHKEAAAQALLRMDREHGIMRARVLSTPLSSR